VTAADPEFEIELDEQHEACRFLTKRESDLHEYVLRYVDDNRLLEE
jgi:hypothetical protein